MEKEQLPRFQIKFALLSQNALIRDQVAFPRDANAKKCHFYNI